MGKQIKPDPERWLAEHGDAMFRYAMLRLRDTDQAEDVVQESFLAALAARERFSGRSSERTWLIGILKHKIIDLIRKRSRERPATELGATDDDDSAINAMFDERGHWKEHFAEWRLDPHAALDQKEFREILAQCLDTLPPRQAEAFILREMEGMKSDEVCKALDITPTNLWAMLHRARGRLQLCLDKNWFQHQGRSKQTQS